MKRIKGEGKRERGSFGIGLSDLLGRTSLGSGEVKIMPLAPAQDQDHLMLVLIVPAPRLPKMETLLKRLRIFLKMEKRNCQISLPPETIADILCYLSRKKLFRDLYLVNRNIWQIATSGHLVPNAHSIKELYIDTRDMQRRYSVGEIQEYVRDFDPKNISGYGNLIGIDNNSKYYRFPVSYFVQKMAAPGPFVRFSNVRKYTFPVSYFLKKLPAPDFVRFGKVRIEQCNDESLVEFLINAKESFVGCDLKIDFHNSISTDAVNKLAYLIRNAFIRAGKIVLNGAMCLTPHPPSNFNYTQELHCALLSWLHEDRNEGSTLVQRESKHLVLGQYPREIILDMVEHVKQAFEDENSPPAAFLVTFLGSEAGCFTPCLEGEHCFSLSKTSTDEKLSFFRTTTNDDMQIRCDRVYRIWRRKVLKKVLDWMAEWSYKVQYVEEVG